MVFRQVESAERFDRLWPILIAAVGKPEADRHDQLREQYLAHSHQLWELRDTTRAVGVIGVRVGDPAEITHIAVDPEYRGRGYGARLVARLCKKHPGITTWWAETDDDAVGFYRRLGFAVERLPPKYPDVTRYRCTLSSP